MNGRLICITGIDGSGKTTLAHSLEERLLRDGIDAVYVYGRVQPVISRLLMAIGRKFLMKTAEREMYEQYDEYSHKKKHVLQSRWVSAVFLASLLFDQIMRVWIAIVPRLLRGSVVISDRYVYDTVFTDIAANLGYDMDASFRLLDATMRLVPRPDLALFIDIDEGVAFSRKTDVPDIRYLAERKKYYQEGGRRLGMTVLEGARPQDEIAAAAYRLALAAIGRGARA